MKGTLEANEKELQNLKPTPVNIHLHKYTLKNPKDSRVKISQKGGRRLPPIVSY
jgi:hypothetical protein